MIVQHRRGASATEFIFAADGEEFALLRECVYNSLKHYDEVGDHDSIRDLLRALDDPTLIKNPEHTGTRRRTDKNKCAVCGEEGGEIVTYRNRRIHRTCVEARRP